MQIICSNNKRNWQIVSPVPLVPVSEYRALCASLDREFATPSLPADSLLQNPSSLSAPSHNIMTHWVPGVTIHYQGESEGGSNCFCHGKDMELMVKLFNHSCPAKCRQTLQFCGKASCYFSLLLILLGHHKGLLIPGSHWPIEPLPGF